MQAHQYMLALAIAWLLTLTVLPYLFAKARQRAYEKGFQDGLTKRDALAWKRLRDTKEQLENQAIELEQVQRKHLMKTSTLLANISELEGRIKGYTGLAVTGADHELMIRAAETLSLARRTWDAMKGSEIWRDRASVESAALQRLAALVHTEVRRNVKPEVAA